MIEWNRSHDWEVRKVIQNRYRVTVCIEGASPSVVELMAVRCCLPEFRDLPPVNLRNAIAQSGGLVLEELGELEFQWLKRRLDAGGVRCRVEVESREPYVCVDRTTSTSLHMEDLEESRRVAEKMIASGVPVVPCEGD